MARIKSVLVMMILFGLFILLGILGGRDNALDVAVIDRLAAFRQAHPGLTPVAVGVTVCGSIYATFGLSCLAAALLWWKRQQDRAGLLLATVLVERLSADGIKWLTARPRPSVDLHPVVTYSSSFPSGHAANTMTAFVAIALLAAPQHYRRPAIAAAILAAGVVALTRPYLGVHWPSDTLAGWALAAMFLLMLRSAAEKRGLLAEQQH